VEHARDWPGVHSVAALLDGEPLTGHWFNRTREYAARNQGEAFSPLQFASEETVELSPSLLGRPVARRLPPTRRASPQDLRETRARRRRDPGARPAAPARQARPLSGAAGPCRDGSSPKVLLRGLRRLRQRLSSRDRSPPPRQPRRPFPGGSFLPALPFFSG
jgi:hypothetical protein